MNILYITQFFPPETGAASRRSYENSKYWSAAGHSVTVLTGFPNYPTGKLYPGYQNRIYEEEKNADLSVVRTFTYIPKYRNIMKRSLNQISYSFFSLLAGRLVHTPDVVIASSPPFGTGFTGYLLARRWKAKFVFEVRDLFPETAIAFGILRNKMLIRMLRRIEKFFYTEADLIVGVTQGICDYVAEIGISRKKVKKITNGVDISTFRKVSGEQFVRENRFQGKFVVMYAGIHGRAEQLSSLVEVAKLLRNRGNINFVLIGEGVEKPRLIELRNRYRLQNMFFFDGCAAEQIPFMLAGADLCFCSRKDVSVNRGSLPVKIFEYMACEKPIVISIKGEAENLVREANAGVCVSPGDTVGLAQAICKLSENKNLRETYGKNGRKYVEKFFSREKIAAQYLDSLLSLVRE